MSESQLLAEILLSCSRGNARLIRTNSGVAWAGRIVSQDHRRLVLSPYHAVKLCPEGTSDLSGLVSEVITPEMVGARVAIFSGIEGKFGKRTLTEGQRAYIQMVRAMGGRAGEARSVAEAQAILRGEIK
jgi:hypothetical protein